MKFKNSLFFDNIFLFTLHLLYFYVALHLNRNFCQVLYTISLNNFQLRNLQFEQRVRGSQIDS